MSVLNLLGIQAVKPSEMPDKIDVLSMLEDLAKDLDIYDDNSKKHLGIVVECILLYRMIMSEITKFSDNNSIECEQKDFISDKLIYLFKQAQYMMPLMQVCLSNYKDFIEANQDKENIKGSKEFYKIAHKKLSSINSVYDYDISVYSFSGPKAKENCMSLVDYINKNSGNGIDEFASGLSAVKIETSINTARAMFSGNPHIKNIYNAAHNIHKKLCSCMNVGIDTHVKNVNEYNKNMFKNNSICKIMDYFSKPVILDVPMSDNQPSYAIIKLKKANIRTPSLPDEIIGSHMLLAKHIRDSLVDLSKHKVVNSHFLEHILNIGIIENIVEQDINNVMNNNQ